MDNKEVSKTKIVLSIIFVLVFLASIVCFVLLGVLSGNKETYNASTMCGLAGFVLLLIAGIGLFHPIFGLGKVFFKYVLFRKKNKDQ